MTIDINHLQVVLDEVYRPTIPGMPIFQIEELDSGNLRVFLEFTHRHEFILAKEVFTVDTKETSIMIEEMILFFRDHLRKYLEKLLYA